MNISVAVVKEENLIPDRLTDADALLLVDVDKMCVTEEYSAADVKGRDVEFAKKTVEWDCEAIICGAIDKDAFNIIADANVTRYLGIGHDPIEATAMMEAYKLPLIREYDGGPGCGGAEAWRKKTGHDGCGCGCEE